jgi:ubiquinone biosynthesis protein COQ9
MTNNQCTNSKLKFNLVNAMLVHVPFDGWSWTALEQGAIDMDFETKLNFEDRKKIYYDLFKNGPIDFIETFSKIIDDEMEKNYESLAIKPDRVPQKIKTIILIRLHLSQKYKEAVRSSLSLTAIPKNSKQSLKILYRTCHRIWKIAGDTSTDFSFYTKRASLAAVYSSTLLFWLNDNSSTQDETESFLDRRLKDISRISNLKKPFFTINKIKNKIDNNKKTLGISSFLDILKKINQIKKSSFS